MSRIQKSISAAIILLCSTTLINPTEAAFAQTSAAKYLRGYYKNLHQSLPIAPNGKRIDKNHMITRIAFGSCNNQNLPQVYWNNISEMNPDLFLMIGDNVYGDIRQQGNAALPTLIKAYSQQSVRKEFVDFRAKIPMMTTWDDHDFGMNDAGGSFAFKEYAQDIYKNYWQSDAATKSHSGVYNSMIVGPVGQRVQIIMLDTRYFRTDLQEKPYQEPAPALGWWTNSSGPDATILGQEQWKWLEEQLAQPAELRLLVSSIQVLTDAHDFEKWGNFPEERKRLLSLIKGKQNIVILSGDRHQAALYKDPETGLHEITSSSLNFSFGQKREEERDPRRITDMISAENYGFIAIHWQKKSLSVAIRASQSNTDLIQPYSIDFKKE